MKLLTSYPSLAVRKKPTSAQLSPNDESRMLTTLQLETIELQLSSSKTDKSKIVIFQCQVDDGSPSSPTY